MRISGSNAPPMPSVNAPGRSQAAAPVEAPTEPPALPAEADTPAQEKAHGLVRAAEHSNRTDVAALRQWINHPELRADLALPDLTAPARGKGFERAVAAYTAAAGDGTPPPAGHEVPPGDAV